VKRLFAAVVVALIMMIAFVLLAPQAPDGTWINDAGQKMSDGLRAFWGNPVAP
jgi:hypothetical protein